MQSRVMMQRPQVSRQTVRPRAQQAQTRVATPIQKFSKEGSTNPADQPTFKLNSGYPIPLVGLGTWKSAPGQVQNAVETALRVGYRHIDCAAAYSNEDEVGKGLSAVLKEGEVKREDIFVVSKLWNNMHDNVEAACKKTLQDLQLDYLDLYLIHWPAPGNNKGGPTLQPPIADVWKQMESLVEKGLVRSIGVSNFSIKKLDALISEAKITPAVNQVEVHPYWRNDKLIDWCRSKGMHVTAYSPLGSPDSAGMDNRTSDTRSPLKEPVVDEIAQQVGKNHGQVLIRWAVQHGTSVLPKSVSAERIKSNLDVFDWEIPADAYKKLTNLPTQFRMVTGTFIVKPEGPYKTVDDVWDEPTPTAEGTAEGATASDKA